MFKKLLILTLALSTAALQAQVKVATVDMARLFDGYTKAQAAEASIKADIQKTSDQIASMQKEGRTLADNLVTLQQKAGNTSLTQEARDQAKAQAADLEKELEQKRISFEKFQNDSRRALVQKEDTQRQTVYREIQNASTAVANKMGATVVLNVSEKTVGNGLPTIVYSDKSYDITDAVLKTLNAGTPASK
jgi:Skp family chaperone for outer membrane proteins